MNKCEKYFWNNYKVKDTFYGAGLILWQTSMKVFVELYKSFGWKFKIKRHHNRVMDFMGIER